MFEIGVVVPTFNRADLIVETLESILNQTHRPAEVIVVDDGSTDDTEAVVSRFREKVKYLRIDNSGECRARNVGTALASTPWIAFCDSDDLWHPEKLARQVSLIKKDPAVEYSFTNFRTVVDQSWSAATKFDSAPADYWNLARRDLGDGLRIVDEPMCRTLLRHQPIFPSTLMMKRTFFEEVGQWREPLGRTPSVDLEFHFRCVARPPIGVVSEAVVGIRKHASNFSGDTLRTTIGETAVLRYILENQPFAKQYGNEIEQEIVRRSASAAEMAFAAGKFDQVRELLRRVPIGDRSWRLHLKGLIAHSPDKVGRLLRERIISTRSVIQSGRTS